MSSSHDDSHRTGAKHRPWNLSPKEFTIPFFDCIVKRTQGRQSQIHVNIPELEIAMSIRFRDSRLQRPDLFTSKECELII